MKKVANYQRQKTIFLGFFFIQDFIEQNGKKRPQDANS